ncbi:hypothetical protein LINPERHAP2_LOCUS18019, partial [Linum perenne]
YVLIDCDWEVEIIHTYREGNKVVNFLANLGHSVSCWRVHYFSTSDPVLGHLLMYDRLGISESRLIFD